jgi:hypothetical protein
MIRTAEIDETCTVSVSAQARQCFDAFEFGPGTRLGGNGYAQLSSPSTRKIKRPTSTPCLHRLSITLGENKHLMKETAAIEGDDDEEGTTK